MPITVLLVEDEDAVRRDFTTLWGTGAFDDIKLETTRARRAA